MLVRLYRQSLTLLGDTNSQQIPDSLDLTIFLHPSFSMLSEPWEWECFVGIYTEINLQNKTLYFDWL